MHRGSGHRVLSLDVCLTGPQHIPIPYCNCAQSKNAQHTASHVFINGHPVCHFRSTFAISHGDELGRHGGIRSGTTGGKATFITHAMNVWIEGQPAVRHLDWMVSNNHNTPPSPLI